ncbi:unnamed protein product [Adineta ricciae]|uniref:Anoctamin n=1 Tax=Adineta ricciae TaxID=249248 RepID=A0A813PID0_ADIRI|nr:unnamed protein product [Adineta ricciae]CAF1222559.1 unnamed protein product [Adineta ricciae]
MNTNLSTEEHDLRDLYPIAEDISSVIRSVSQQTTSTENHEREETIDFILVYEETASEDIDPFERAQKAMRKNFEANLQHYGLVLNYRTIRLKHQQQRVFVLITTPFEKLLEMAEITRNSSSFIANLYNFSINLGTYLPFDRVNPVLRQLLTYPPLTHNFPQLFLPDSSVFQEKIQRSNYVFYPYSKRLHKKFARHFFRSNVQTILKTHTFTIAQRTRLTYEILSRIPISPPSSSKLHTNIPLSELKRISPLYLSNTSFQSLTINPSLPVETTASFSSIAHDDIIEKLNESHRHRSIQILSSHQYAYGINILIKIGIYITAYAPHEDCRKDKQMNNTRELLYLHWARIKHIQPIELIRAYFGENVALYFVFLGWYTYMLMLPSIIGCFVIIYSTINAFFDIPTIETCVNISKEYLCPQRTRKKYVSIGNDCLTKRFSTVFDNYSTHMFGVFMIFWVLCLRRFWQRYLARFQYYWSVYEDERRHELTRSSFLIQSTQTKINRINGIEEPFISLWIVLVCRLLSVLVLLIFLGLSTLNLILMLYIRLKLFHIFHSIRNDLGKENSFIVISIIASTISLTISVILDFLFGYVANRMTEFERHRYQSDFDASLTLKLFIFAFVNYYSVPIYIAFFKPWIPSLPGNEIAGVKSYFVFTEKLEPCNDLTGCSYEISVILLITLIGKQLVNAMIEILTTKFLNLINYLQYHRRELNSKRQRSFLSINGITDDVTAGEETSTRERAAWETDIYLQRLGRWQLYNEYMEIMVQYGFVAMFSIALPVAPFLAMINNLFELRTDANKLLFEFRRPIGELAYTLGIWEKIFDVLSKLAILANVLYLLITCDLIPKLFFMYIEKNNSLTNYINYTLSYFDINDLDDREEVHQGKQLNITYCRYRDFRYDDGSSYKYQTTPIYYQMRMIQWLSIFFLLILIILIY